MLRMIPVRRVTMTLQVAEKLQVIQRL